MCACEGDGIGVYVRVLGGVGVYVRVMVHVCM